MNFDRSPMVLYNGQSKCIVMGGEVHAAKPHPKPHRGGSCAYVAKGGCLAACTPHTLIHCMGV